MSQMTIYQHRLTQRYVFNEIEPINRKISRLLILPLEI